MILRVAALLCTHLALAACGSSGGDSASAPAPVSAPVTIIGLPANADVFDPAPARASGDATTWMSYSHVTSAAGSPMFQEVHTRLASTTDGGANWQDSGAVLIASAAATAPAPDSGKPARWRQEVSRLAHDPHATGGRWLLLWHRYLAVFEAGTNTTQRLFQHGWIGLKTAATPGALASATERKLFAGAGYDAANDAVIGPPEFRLDLLFPGAAQLGACLVFSEAAVLTAVDGIYVAMKCAAASGGKIFGLRCDHSFSSGSCAYLGDFVTDADAALLDSSWGGFSAPEFAITATKTYLVVTPTLANDTYRGCLALQVASLNPASVMRAAGKPIVINSIAPTGDFNGACGHAASLTANGLLYSQATFTAPPSFRLVASRIVLPD